MDVPDIAGLATSRVHRQELNAMASRGERDARQVRCDRHIFTEIKAFN